MIAWFVAVVAVAALVTTTERRVHRELRARLTIQADLLALERRRVEVAERRATVAEDLCRRFERQEQRMVTLVTIAEQRVAQLIADRDRAIAAKVTETVH